MHISYVTSLYMCISASASEFGIPTEFLGRWGSPHRGLGGGGVWRQHGGPRDRGGGAQGWALVGPRAELGEATGDTMQRSIVSICHTKLK